MVILLKKLIPNIYQKDIYTINYKKLFKQGKRILFFDLDNTMVPYCEENASPQLVKLISCLKKIGFTVYIFSNSLKGKKVQRIANTLDINYNLGSCKPLKHNYLKLMKKYNYSKDEIVMIGDQLYTDILGGNKIGLTTILVEPSSLKEALPTKILRNLETKTKSKLAKKGYLIKDKYYE